MTARHAAIILFALALLVLAAASCGDPMSGPPDMVTAQELQVWDDTKFPIWGLALSDQVAAHEDAVFDVLGHDLKWVAYADDIRILLTDDCELLNNCKLAGVTYILPGHYDIYVLWHDKYATACAGWSALAHELTHLALFLLELDADPGHTKDYAWGADGIVWLAKRRHLRDFPCP
jgi:hypothetical protein